MTLHSALYTASCADIRLSGLNCNSFCSKSTACSLLLERWRTCLNLSKSNQKKALIGPMQTLIVTVVFHTRHCFELHRGNANRDLRVEAAKRPEDGAKWREIGGYAVCRIRQSHPEIDATNPH